MGSYRFKINVLHRVVNLCRFYCCFYLAQLCTRLEKYQLLIEFCRAKQAKPIALQHYTEIFPK